MFPVKLNSDKNLISALKIIIKICYIKHINISRGTLNRFIKITYISGENQIKFE